MLIKKNRWNRHLYNIIKAAEQNTQIVSLGIFGSNVLYLRNLHGIKHNHVQKQD